MESASTLDYAALIIATLSMFVAAYSVYESRRHNRVSQIPALVGNEFETGNSYAYEVANKGNGHAFFERVEYFQNCRPLEPGDFRDAVRTALDQAGIQALEVATTRLADNSVLAPGETVVIGKIIFSPDSAPKFVAMRQETEFDLRITYTSAHGTRKIWTSNDDLEGP